MPEDCEEMEAIIAYMEWLSDDVPEKIAKIYKGYVDIKIPDYKADPELGKELYQKNCLHCHMENGTGKQIPGANFTGYSYNFV